MATCIRPHNNQADEWCEDLRAHVLNVLMIANTPAKALSVHLKKVQRYGLCPSIRDYGS